MVPFNNSFGTAYFDDSTKFNIALIDILIKLIFAVDLMLQFRKAFPNPLTGVEVRDPKLIAIRYFKFYFWVDLISAIPFDIITNNKYLRMIALVKIFRLFRLKKLMSWLGLD